MLEWAEKNLNIEAGIPVILMGEIAFEKVLSGVCHIRVPFPISIGFPFHPFASLIPFFQFLQQILPWPYIYLCPNIHHPLLGKNM